MKSSSYWAAGHITAFFKIADSKNDILNKGSQGVGFNIKRGVITKVSKSNNNFHKISFDGIEKSSITTGITNYVLDEFQRLFNYTLPFLEIQHEFQIPIGSGYGSSAAAALSLAFAINSYLNLDVPELNLWQIAHKAEIINKTGLGDVLGLYSQSTFEMRTKEGAPGVGNVVSLDFDVSDYDLYTYSLGPLSKKFLLTDSSKRALIMSVGEKALEKFKLNPTFENFCSTSFLFTQNLNLLPKKLWEIITSLPSTIKTSQIMLGESLFFFVPKNEHLPNLGDVVLINEELENKTIKKLRVSK
jgi:pantoate kinase